MRSVTDKLKHLDIKRQAEVLTSVREMSEWEHGFVKDVWEHWQLRKTLSDKQITRIHEIYDKYFEA